ncbi:MAG: FAD-dependent monooxygenase, partial [Rhodospirillales bacterium]|nr:FAD-dependent monooxygenase [Rhodospirillales bacterium]
MHSAVPPDFDIAIVGGGLAGSLLATLLGRAGRHVAVIDRHAVYPSDFRAEQIVGAQCLHFQRLGLLRAVVGDAPPVTRALAAMGGKVIGQVEAPHYGLPYEALVARVRATVPESVPWLTGRVVEVGTGIETQAVTLADGRRLTARLVILANGLQRALQRELGFERRVLRAGHSLSFGFDLVPTADHGAPCPVLVHIGGRRDGVDYLTTFPMGGATRANLFTYWDHRSPPARAFRQDPEPVLRQIFPRLSAVLGGWRVGGPVQARVTDVETVANPIRDGVVLVGDAFQTSCPATGTGISRLLTDVEQLCTVHLPAWLASPGMAAEKIAGFYADPVKLAADREALQAAEYRRALATAAGAGWAAHRTLLGVRRRIGG